MKEAVNSDGTRGQEFSGQLEGFRLPLSVQTALNELIESTGFYTSKSHFFRVAVWREMTRYREEIKGTENDVPTWAGGTQ